MPPLSKSNARRKVITVETAQILWLENGTPYSEKYQDIYFSQDGGFIETEYVFLKHNGLPQRFYNQADTTSQNPIKIAETGFGSGLNFLVTAYHWSQITDFKKNIDYISVEKYPMEKQQLIQAYQLFKYKWPQLSRLCDELIQQYPECFKNNQKQSFDFYLCDDHIHLKLLINDATLALQSLLTKHHDSINAWYLDGFAPAKNPDMWTQELFETMAKLSRTGSTLSTFTAAGFVRRGLTEAGFKLSKAPGYGKKRELLYGIL